MLHCEKKRYFQTWNAKGFILCVFKLRLAADMVFNSIFVYRVL